MYPRRRQKWSAPRLSLSAGSDVFLQPDDAPFSRRTIGTLGESHYLCRVINGGHIWRAIADGCYESRRRRDFVTLECYGIPITISLDEHLNRTASAHGNIRCQRSVVAVDSQPAGTPKRIAAHRNIVIESNRQDDAIRQQRLKRDD